MAGWHPSSSRAPTGFACTEPDGRPQIRDGLDVEHLFKTQVRRCDPRRNSDPPRWDALPAALTELFKRNDVAETPQWMRASKYAANMSVHARCLIARFAVISPSFASSKSLAPKAARHTGLRPAYVCWSRFSQDGAKAATPERTPMIYSFFLGVGRTTHLIAR